LSNVALKDETVETIWFDGPCTFIVTSPLVSVYELERVEITLNVTIPSTEVDPKSTTEQG
jgi:hypothetical protein